MQNIFDTEYFKLEEYNPGSAGVALAKRLRIAINIIRLYGATIFFLAYYLIFYVHGEFFNRWLFPSAKINLGIAIILFTEGIVLAYKAQVIKKAKKLSLEERLDYDVVLYQRGYYKRKISRNTCLLTIAKLLAQMNDKERCKEAIENMTEGFNPDSVVKLKKWIDSDEELDPSCFEQQKMMSPFKVIYIFWLMAFAFGFVCTHYTNYYWAGFSKLAVGIFGLLSIIGFSLVAPMLIIYSLVIYTYVTGKEFKTQKFRKILLRIVILISVIVNVICRFEVIDFGFDLSNDEYTVEDTYDESDYDDYSYDDYSSSDDYEADYYFDEEADDSEEYYMDDVTIMNQMIILCNYLVKEGIIPDFSIELGYNAKGYVKAEIAKDEDYVYMLYDNGMKDDEYGNSCIELVLEAEPLDENGNSLGQAEASLKGFYLVNAEKKTVIDEHKTHW